MADPGDDCASISKPQIPSTSDKNVSASERGENVNGKDEDSLQSKVDATRIVCQQCGAHSWSTLKSELVDPVNPHGDLNTSTNANKVADADENPLGDGSTPTENKESKPKKRTRIGRFILDRATGKEQLVDQDVASLDAPSTEDFVIAIKNYSSWSPMGPIHSWEQEKSSLVIISTSLAKAYRSVVKDADGFIADHGMRLNGKTPTISEPYASLFFHFDDISKACRSSEFACEDDFSVLAQFYSDRILPEHNRVKALLAEDIVLYDDLWALFCPGDIIYSVDEFEDPCLHMLISTDYRTSDRTDPDPHKRSKRMVADMWRIGWDQSTGKFNRVLVTTSIATFIGSRAITSLPFYPIKHFRGGSLEEIAKLRAEVQHRGNQWKDLISQKPRCWSYKGPARKLNSSEKQYLSERVIIDGNVNAFEVAEDISAYGSRRVAHVGGYEETSTSRGLDNEHQRFDSFSPEQTFENLQAQLCPSTANCYCVGERTWYVVAISRTEEVKWQEDAIDQLVLEQSTKDMLVGLVKQHQANKEKILSDIIPTKGKGLVVVLHGSPGVGKTLTAEVIAEFTKKPLYPINIGELTSEARIVSKLQWHFTMASRWDAILLLDEADVLLEKRSYENLQRNGIVSVFLRMLEYYDGMLFLTTNRVKTIDDAFQSRIQIAIKFPDLTPDMRRQIWTNFINRLDKKEAKGKHELFDHLDDLQEWNLNGRQIRNILTTAESMALSLERRRGALGYRQVEEVANHTIYFQDLFDDTKKEHKAQLGNFNSRPSRPFQEQRVTQYRY